jgi:DNA repair protein RecO (recombination protein O)
VSAGPSPSLTPAVVLRTRALGEADLVVVLLTPGRGKLDCVAKAARRSRKRFPGGLAIGARGQAEIAEHSRGSLLPLTSFVASADHTKVGRDLELFAYIAYLADLSDRLLDTTVADPTIFAQLCDAIAAAMAQTSPTILRRYELGLLDGLGLLPALDRCSVCGSPVDEQAGGIAFSRQRGGALCLAHSRAADRIPTAVLALAQALLGPDPELAASAYAEAEAPTRRILRDLCRDLIQPHLRGPLRSLEFFAQIRQPKPD